VGSKESGSFLDQGTADVGVIASNGQVETWKVQARAALKRSELTPDELRETLVMLAPYAGYPNIAGLVVPCEEVIGTWLATDRRPGTLRTGPSRIEGASAGTVSSNYRELCKGSPGTHLSRITRNYTPNWCAPRDLNPEPAD
jgi:hypothetical protein